MQNFSDVVQGKHFQIGVECRGVSKMFEFQRENGHISVTVRSTATFVTNH